MIKKFARGYLTDDLDLPDRPHKGVRHGRIVISNEIVEHTRWSVHHELIFRLEDQPPGEAWRVTYSVGATESQDEGPWDNEDEVEATLVRRVPRVVEVWADADEPQEVPRGTVLGGPIEMRDYDYITLAMDHRVETPDTERTAVLPAGSRLYMVKPEPGALGVTWETGTANKAPDATPAK